jgi:hypothetical protein
MLDRRCEYNKKRYVQENSAQKSTKDKLHKKGRREKITQKGSLCII